MKAFEFLDKVKIDDVNTMVLDKGLGYKFIEDSLKITGDYFNFLKYGWGTSMLYNKEIIQDKNELYHSYDIRTYPGGTLLELANSQNKVAEFLEEADNLGFNAIEISDGSSIIDAQKRAELIDFVKDAGYFTLTEVGKKSPEKDHEYSIEDRIQLIKTDIENKSDMVIIEGRESGKNIGIYDGNGNIKTDDLIAIHENTPKDKIMWEAPNKNQQVELILKLGNNVNLGNINFNEIISVTTLRKGLRGDTFLKL